MGDTVRYEREDILGYITLNRPQVLNAMNRAWIEDLVEAVRQAHADHTARVVIVRGAGRAFCAGADLKEAPQQQDMTTYRDTFVNPQQDVARLLRRLEKPLLAQVHGYAVGGGCELAMLADMRIAAAGTKFGFTEVRVGATVTMGGLHNLARIVGLGRAFELLYTTTLIDAEEAWRIGLVNRVVPAEHLEAAVRAMARRIAEAFPLELALTRSSLYRATDLDFEAAIGDEARAALLSFMGGARMQGMAAAVERLRQNKPAE